MALILWGKTRGGGKLWKMALYFEKNPPKWVPSLRWVWISRFDWPTSIQTKSEYPPGAELKQTKNTVAFSTAEEAPHLEQEQEMALMFIYLSIFCKT